MGSIVSLFMKFSRTANCWIVSLSISTVLQKIKVGRKKEIQSPFFKNGVEGREKRWPWNSRLLATRGRKLISLNKQRFSATRLMHTLAPSKWKGSILPTTPLATGRGPDSLVSGQAGVVGPSVYWGFVSLSAVHISVSTFNRSWSDNITNGHKAHSHTRFLLPSPCQIYFYLLLWLYSRGGGGNPLISTVTAWDSAKLMTYIVS